jgi:hypothetical protein
MTYRVHRKNEADPIVDLKSFAAAAKWCVEHAPRVGGDEFVIVRYEKRGRNVTTEVEAAFEVERETVDDLL